MKEDFAPAIVRQVKSLAEGRDIYHEWKNFGAAFLMWVVGTAAMGDNDFTPSMGKKRYYWHSKKNCFSL